MAGFPNFPQGFPMDPMQMMEAMQKSFASMMPGAQTRPAFDPAALMESQKKNMDALMAANTAAAEAYQALYKKQLEVFESTVAEAQKSVEGFDPAAPQANPQVAQKVLELAMCNMTDLAQEAGKANAEAFRVVQERIAASVQELSKGLG